MVLVLAIRGWEPRDCSPAREEPSPWLRSSQLAVRTLEQTEEREGQLPVYLAAGICAADCALSFAVFW